jgi:hypothetical protein
MSTARPSDMPDSAPLGFDPAGVVGEISADGQPTHVTALASDQHGHVVFLSLVGYEASVSTALAWTYSWDMSHIWDGLSQHPFPLGGGVKKSLWTPF